MLTIFLYTLSYVNALVNISVIPYHAKNNNVYVIIFLLFKSLFKIKGRINPIKKQNINVAIPISNFCKGDK